MTTKTQNHYKLQGHDLVWGAGLRLRKNSEILGIARTNNKKNRAVGLLKRGLRLTRDGFGYCLTIDSDLKLPINIFYESQKAKKMRAKQPKLKEGAHPRRLKIIVEAGVRAHLREFFTGGADGEEQKIVTNILLKDKAALWHYKINLSSGANLTATTKIWQDQESYYGNFYYCEQRARQAKINNDIEVVQKKKRATCVLDGLFLAQKRQKITNTTRVWQEGAKNLINQEYRGLAREAALGFFDGLISVAPKARGASVKQFSRNLVLSPRATIKTRPQLILQNPNLQAQHGASVGRLDPSQLFYLRARGLSNIAAQKMLVQAFAQSLINKIDDRTIKNLISLKISQWV